MKKEIIQRLYQAAKTKLTNTNYTKDKAVAAAILTKEGKIFTGVCFKFYPRSICAEIVALSQALSEGYQNIECILVTSKRKELIWPCGHCRRDMYKLLDDNNYKNNDLKIISYRCGKGEKYQIKKLSELYPNPC